MMYNGKYAEYDYSFNPNNVCSLFERLAYNLLSYMTKNEENVEFRIHSKMYATGEFQYSMDAYVEGIQMPLASYTVENFNEVYSEDIQEDGLLIYHKGQHNQYELAWDKKFFGIDTIMYNEELYKALENYSLC